MTLSSQNSNPLIFRAAILERNHAPLRVAEVAFEGPLKPGQVLVQVYYSGICGKQIEEIAAARGPDPYLPHMLGHEGSGVVLAVGPDVSKVRAGDRVVMHWMKGAGIDAEKPMYRYAGENRRVNAGWVTTFNDHAVVSENRVTQLPRDTNLRVACLLGCAASTGIGTALNEASLRTGDSLTVIGCGGVGLNVIQGARLADATPIVAVDGRAASLQQARAFGATHTVISVGSESAALVRAVTGGKGTDVVVVTANSSEAIELGFQSCATPGRVFVLGVPPTGATVTLDAFSLHLKRSITGAIGGGILPEKDIPEYWRLYRSGQIKLDELVTMEVDLEDINRAIDSFRQGTLLGRAIVRMRHMLTEKEVIA